MEAEKWVLEVPKESNGWSLVKSFEKEICTIYGGQLRNENNEEIIGEISNKSKKIGLLISKAPEMLEMLKLFSDFPDEDFKEKESNEFYTFSIKVSDMIKAKKLIKEATDI